MGSEHLADRAVAELSGGELQRVCLASAVALRPRLLLLDEPTSQLDPDAAESFLEHVSALGIAVLISDHRPRRVLEHADRVVFLDEGRILLDAPVPAAREWLARQRPLWVETFQNGRGAGRGEPVCRLNGVQFAYGTGPPVVDGIDLELRRGEIVALAGANGAGKTTVAKLAAGLLSPDAGTAAPSGVAARVRRVGCVPVPHFNVTTPIDELDGVGHIPGYVPDVLFPISAYTARKGGIHVTSPAASVSGSHSRRCW